MRRHVYPKRKDRLKVGFYAFLSTFNLQRIEINPVYFSPPNPWLSKRLCNTQRRLNSFPFCKIAISWIQTAHAASLPKTAADMATTTWNPHGNVKEICLKGPAAPDYQRHLQLKQFSEEKKITGQNINAYQTLYYFTWTAVEIKRVDFFPARGCFCFVCIGITDEGKDEPTREGARGDR